MTTTGTVRHGLEELRRSFGTIESCLHLVDTRAASLRDRVALDIVRTEASRAGSRLVRCLAALDADPAIVARLQPIDRSSSRCWRPRRPNGGSRASA